MIARLSTIATVLALLGAVSAAPKAKATVASSAAAPNPTTPTTPSTAAPPVLNLPPFSGTFVNKYPTQDAIPPTNSAEVTAWLAELNMASVPVFPVVPFNANGDPTNPTAVPADACDWTVTNCINKDLTTCPLGVWGLTYDDGPTTFSGALYDELDKTNQKATLFYIGSNVIQNWQLARRACEAGHQIAVHTWSHHPSTSLTNEQFVAEVKWTETAIKEICGFTPRYFRPPYGDIDNRIRGLLTQMGYTNVIWDYDTNDWQLPPGGTKTTASVEQEFATWFANAHNDTTGHITLEHELYQATVDEAIKNLPKIQSTWKTMPVSACMNDAHPYKETNITLATMDGKAVTGVNVGTTPVSNVTTTASAPPSAKTPNNVTGSPSGSSSFRMLSKESGTLAAFVAVAIAAFIS
ncbi:hypothetical protein B0O80DRAFT_440583 [Mortierella sp. GBAus27b]|nr:chitin deacetylase [Mortierella sp. GBA43]KAI8359573.1 hypothetical protein B0O80DRAFT_440583 [Mortierella sp. GBAus27b]